MANHQNNYTSNFEGQDPAGNAGLFLFLNTHEHQYRPSGSNTVVRIPVPEKIDVSSANLHTTIRHILNEQGDPVLVSGNKEYRYSIRGTNEYVFVCVTDESTVECLMVNDDTGVVSTKYINIDSVVYVLRSADNIFSTIANIVIGGRMPVITDNGTAFYLASISGADIRFVRTDTASGDVHVLNIAPDNTITETTLQANEVLRILIPDPVQSGLTQEEYDAIPQHKMTVLVYGIGSTNSYAHLQSYGSNTTFIHQTSTGYDLFDVTQTATPVDPSDPDSPLYHVVTKTSYTYDSSAMTMRNFKATDISDTVNGHSAFQLANDEMWVMEDWDGGWTAQLAFITPDDTDNNCVVRFENATFNTTYYPTGYPIEIWNHSKNTQLTPLNGSITAMKLGCSYEIRIYGDKYYCCEVWNAQNAPVTDAELQHAIDTLKSRIIYTIPIGAIDRIETMSLPAQNTDVTVLATLFNPTMDQDLGNDSNVVLNFGPSQSNPNLLMFAIYQFISDPSDPNYRKWQWVANTADVSTNNPLTGIMHFPLLYRSQTITKLSSSHLYLFCAIGQSTSNLECMGNELTAYINMNSASLALATGKQNQDGYTSVATLGTDIPYLDLTTFSESVAQGSGGNPARLFAAITNLTNLP